MKTWGPNENLTLTLADIEACRPVRSQGGRVLRAFCPIHGSDHQRSLRVDLQTDIHAALAAPRQDENGPGQRTMP